VGNLTDDSTVGYAVVCRYQVALDEEDEELVDVLEDDEEPLPDRAPVEELDDEPDDELEEERPAYLLTKT
jgi:hypothetical protein